MDKLSIEDVETEVEVAPYLRLVPSPPVDDQTVSDEEDTDDFPY